MAEIDVKVLREKICKLLEAIEREHGRIIPCEEQLFWHIPYGKEFDFSVKPDLDVGDILSDIEFISDRKFSSVYELTYFIEVFRFLIVEKSSAGLSS